MQSFFYGWRRKAGAITLVMALAFMLGWVRSCVCFDWLAISLGSNTHYFIMSQGHRVGVQYSHGRASPNSLDWGSGFHTALSDDLSDTGIPWRHYWVFHVTDDTWVFSYWFIVIPLTLLSAYLLLWKPRKRSSPI